MLKIVIPHIDMDGIARRRGLSPKLARREAHRINMLPLLAPVLSIGIRENNHAVVADDLAGLATRISGQSRMPHRIDVPCPNPLPYLE